MKYHNGSTLTSKLGGVFFVRSIYYGTFAFANAKTDWNRVNNNKNNNGNNTNDVTTTTNKNNNNSNNTRITNNNKKTAKGTTIYVKWRKLF